jgi:hypothetical protein
MRKETHTDSHKIEVQSIGLLIIHFIHRWLAITCVDESN